MERKKNKDSKDDHFNIDAMLEQLGGCGQFQVFLVFVQSLAWVPFVFSAMTMVFIGYNPGWRCKDNLTSSANNISWIYDSCDDFDECSDLEFKSGTSSIVTEWGLDCGNFYKVSTVISMQMVGTLVGTLFVGSIGDKFGRKVPYQISYIFLIVFNLIAYYSVSWQMYGATMVLVGFFEAFSSLDRVLMLEFVVEKWRVRINSLPIWSLITILFSLLAWWLRDWRKLRLIIIILCATSFLLLFLIPRSLRWLFVQRKNKEFLKTAKRVAETNKAKTLDDNELQAIYMKKDGDKGERAYFLYHLFRKGYCVSTLVLGFWFFVNSLTSYGIGFGITALPGNFYTNMIIYTLTDIPSNILGLGMATIWNRKPTAFCFLLLDSVCLFGVVAFDQFTPGYTRETVIMTMVCIAKVGFYVGWMVLFTSMQEMYPTCIRGTVNSYHMFLANAGGAAAPYMVPSDDSWFWVMYLIMAILNLMSTFLILLLPETKGKPMLETFEDEDRLKETKGDPMEMRHTDTEVVKDENKICVRL